ncbi:MAG TPA: PqqD family protein [Gaiellaceae bacterium]|nr:PqqD family protein [Gaiellaceae bacterium]
MSDHPKLGPDSRVSIGASVYARSFGDEIVLLDFARGEYFGLDEVGAEVWRGLEKGRSLSEIAELIVERFEVAREQALADIIEIVDDMMNNSLVHAP